MQEETDVIMIAISEVLDGARIRVMFDDTDVIVLIVAAFLSSQRNVMLPQPKLLPALV